MSKTLRVSLLLFVMFTTLSFPVSVLSQSPRYPVSKPPMLRLYDTKEFRVLLRLLLIYNGTERGSLIGFGHPLFVNNFWSSVQFEKVRVVEGKVENFFVDTYDLNVLVGKYYKKVPNTPDYGFVHHVIVLNLRADYPRQEYIVDVLFRVRVSRVDGSRLSIEECGTISDAIRELGEDYETYTNATYYWDYDNPIVQKILSSLRKTIERKYSRRLEEIPIPLIVREILNWLSYNTYYMERFDYPYFRLRVSQLLNRTIEVEGRKKYYGVCRHIVDIFVALARGLGVPANRYEGLVFGEFNNKIVFYGFHAWAEVYVPKVGWVPAEVTITHPLERDLIDLGDLEYMYYVPIIHEYNSFKPPMLPPVLPVVLSVRILNVTAAPSRVRGQGWLPHTIYIPTLGYIPLRDFALITVIALLLIDDIYLHRKAARLTSVRRTQEEV